MDEQKKDSRNRSRWIYIILALIILLLLLCALFLGWIFWDLLPPGLFGRHPKPTPAEVQPIAPTNKPSVGTEGAAHRAGPLGMSGRKRKFGYKTPSSVGGGQSALAARQEEEWGRADLAAGNVPLMFEAFCNEYGGDFDFFARGAGLDVKLSNGEICLNMRRAEVDVPKNEKLIYKPGGREIDGCALKASATVCLRMHNVNPAVRGTGVSDAGTEDDCLPDSRLWRWHGLTQTNRPVESVHDTVRANGRSDLSTDRAGITEVSRNNFYIGDQPTQWFSDLPAFATVQYKDLYPGIDLNCYGDQNRLEYVFVIWPGADPSQISFSIDGAEGTYLDSSGNIVIEFECGKIVQRAPQVYQIIAGRAELVPSSYVYDPHMKSYQFAVSPYVTDKPLIARPTIEYMSYLGGTGTERGYAVAVDDAGYGYIAGESTSPRFGIPKSGDRPLGNNVDVFVTKFRISDARPIYTTFLGGYGEERALGLAPAPDGGIYVCGETTSEDFPPMNPMTNLKPGASWDAFLTHLDGSGRIAGMSFHWGGSGDERAYGVAVDPQGNPYVAGETSSPDFPSTYGIHPVGGGRVDAFVARFLAASNTLDYMTTLGGSEENGAFSIAVDSRQCAYLAGQTSSKDFPVARPFQRLFGGGMWDAFVTKVGPDGKSLQYSTYLGGKGDDFAYGITVDVSGQAYIAGESSSPDYPLQSAAQPMHGGGYWDAILTKFTGEGNRLVYSTYFGGSGDDRGFAVAADAAGATHIVGATTSSNFPSYKALQRGHGGGDWDGFVTRLEPAGSPVAYSSWLGGSGNDYLYSAAVDGSRIVHVAGATVSTNMTVVRPLQSWNRGGGSDVLLSAIRPEQGNPPELNLVKKDVQPGGPAYDFYMSKYEITNNEFVRFLNDAQANPANWRGTNMFFDALGNVWISPQMVLERDEMFSITDSRIVYRREAPPGTRYSVTPKAPPNGGSYGNHPVVGVSWYGAIKYCNWLTLDSGRGADQRCYREGTNILDWAPIACNPTNWAQGMFTESERKSWLAYKGFRLPMDNSAGNKGTTNAFFKVSNQDFARFLNDAQSHPSHPRGSNMLFDPEGNVWFNAARKSARDELFRVGDSRLLYVPEQPLGSRYAVTLAQAPEGGSYSNHPVNGVSWFGAMKYCNWLTLDKGMDASERCYREGTNQLDWAPVTIAATNWADCRFGPADRVEWRSVKTGCKLPLVTTEGFPNWSDTSRSGALGTNSFANPFNEFYKAAAWNGRSNTVFGFGRSEIDARDANFLDSGALSWHDTTPVGYYDGSSHGGVFQTRTNENPFGIYDLSGNVTEWLSDPGQANSPLDRACYGGSWLFAMSALHERQFVHPYFTDNFRGFRIVTMAPAGEMYVVRTPYRICLCGAGVGEGCGRAHAEEEESWGATRQEEQTLQTRQNEGQGSGSGSGSSYQQNREERREGEQQEQPQEPIPESPNMLGLQLPGHTPLAVRTGGS
jgi:formylglycine-generating enzyme required for sulfatase activity